MTILGRTHYIEAYVTRQLPTELIIGLPAIRRMGAVIDTVDLSISFRSDPHRKLDILVENGAPKEVYTVLENTELPAYLESLVQVRCRAMGLCADMTEKQWREIAPNYATEQHKKLLIAPGVSKGPVVQLLVANISDKPQKLLYGTRIATGEAMEKCRIQDTSLQRPSGLYDEYDYELPPEPAQRRNVDMQQVCQELRIEKL